MEWLSGKERSSLAGYVRRDPGNEAGVLEPGVTDTDGIVFRFVGEEVVHGGLQSRVGVAAGLNVETCAEIVTGFVTAVEAAATTGRQHLDIRVDALLPKDLDEVWQARELETLLLINALPKGPRAGDGRVCEKDDDDALTRMLFQLPHEGDDLRDGVHDVGAEDDVRRLDLGFLPCGGDEADLVRDAGLSRGVLEVARHALRGFDGGDMGTPLGEGDGETTAARTDVQERLVGLDVASDGLELRLLRDGGRGGGTEAPREGTPLVTLGQVTDAVRLRVLGLDHAPPALGGVVLVSRRHLIPVSMSMSSSAISPGMMVTFLGSPLAESTLRWLMSTLQMPAGRETR